MALGTPIKRQCARDAALARRDLSRLVNEFVAGFGLPPYALAPERKLRFAPVVEAVELPDAYRIRAELPGVDATDLEVLVEEGRVTIKGQRRFEADAGAEAGAEGDVERFERRLRFADEIEDGAVKAVYKNGLLTVTVPKREEVKPEARRIAVASA